MKGYEKVLLGTVLAGGVVLVVVLGLVLFQTDSEEDAAPDSAWVVKERSGEGEEGGISTKNVGEVPLDEAAPRPEIEKLPAGKEAAAAKSPSDGGTITGRIVSEYGDPLPGAAVTFGIDYSRAFWNDNDFKPGEGISIKKVSCKTEKDGRFRLENARAKASARLLVSHPEYVPRDYALKGFDGTSMDVGDIPLEAGGVVFGYVLNESGTALGSAEVSAQPSRPGEHVPYWHSLPFAQEDTGWRGVTGPDGFFRLTGLPEGKVDVMASHPEHVSSMVKDVAVAKGREKGRIEVILPDGHIIAGRVVNEEDEPVGGAKVGVDRSIHIDLDMDEDRSPFLLGPSRVETGKDGYFRITGLEEGSYNVRASALSFLPYRSGKVNAGTRDLVIILQSGGWTAGYVTDARSGKPLDAFDIKVRQGWLERTDFKVLKGRQAAEMMPEGSRPEGAFYIEGLRAEPFHLLFTAKGYADKKIPNLIMDSGALAPMTVELWEESRVSGRLLDAAGKPVSGGTLILKEPQEAGNGDFGRLRRGVRIERNEDEVLIGDEGDEWAKRASSDEKGEFLFIGVPDGKYHLIGSHEEHIESDPVEVEVQRGGEAKNMEVRLGVAGAVAGKVFDVEGNPKPGARIHAQSVEDPVSLLGRRTVSDGEGAYRIQGLAPGEYLVRLVGDPQGKNLGGFMMVTIGSSEEDTGAHRVTVEAGRVTELDLYETLKGSIKGAVLEAGKPVPDATVKLFKGGDFAFMPLETQVTDEDGAFAFEHLEAGSYKVRLDLPGINEHPEEEVSVEAGFETRKDFDLPTGRVSGRITDAATGRPAPGVKVSLGRPAADEDPAEGEPGRRVEIQMVSVFKSQDDGEVETITMSGGGMQPTLTDENGCYVIRFVKDGVYAVVASGGGYAKCELSPVEVKEGRETSGQDMALQQGYNVSGRLKNAATGDPISHVVFSCVKLEGGEEIDSTEDTVFAQGDGSFEIRDLDPGLYRLKMDSDRYKGSKEFSLKKGSLKNLEFLVQPLK